MTPDSLVQEAEHLYSLPDVALRVNQLIGDPASQPSDLAEVILCDPALSARLLRLINSAFYARPHPVETVTQAINMIGYEALRDLVFATSAVEVFKGLPREQMDMERFWLNSVACGVAARKLASLLSVPESERLFITGLLHSLGKLVLLGQRPEAYRDVLKLTEQDGLDVFAAEQRVFGFNQAELTAALLRNWQLPESLWQPIAHHLDPEAALHYRPETEILCAAREIANLFQASMLDGEAVQSDAVTQRLQALAKRLGLAPESMTDLPCDINLQVTEMYEIMLPGWMLVY
ncbi:HDOD domain-containing protein [Halochromatium glycolicum]|jgi:HD-like signal output (HDOD) protein|uniref:Histidine kinase n=1 Tax=Halochromatium glycolicum TaxID=85075 RepID=A0AAJ0X8Y0_9GAMM|nr:HDOD domain-containing protein [Halochromatium glycolicum]MBK1704269.1 histidine kinase [Halochromatium glycolicum]